MLQKNCLRFLLVLALIAPLSGCLKSIEVDQYLVDFKNGACLQRRYEYATDYIGQKSEFRIVDPQKCIILIGHDPEDYKKVSNMLDDIL
jgi:hypothetical protein